MARIKKITGLNVVIRNMTKAKGVLGRDIARGLMKGGLYLQKKSQEITPVDLGPLYASAFTRNVGGSGFKTDIIVGYGAEGVGYAVFVHEDLDKLHGRKFNVKYAKEIATGTMNNRGENQQAKFLERPAREEKKRIIKIIQRAARV